MEEYKYPLAPGDKLVSPERKDNSGKVIAPKREYTITEVLGQGGFGITYKATSVVEIAYGNIVQKTTMQFAVKEFFMKDCCDRYPDGRMRYSNPVKESVEDGLHSFISEARRLNNICHLNHNIVGVNEVFEANNTAYFVMEYLDGGDLRQLLSQNGGKGLREDQALAIIQPIVEAMQAVHKEKILHLDIKPDNIVLRRVDDGSSDPVLIDFGLSIHFNKQGNVTSTKKTGGFSEGYSPKEQYAPIQKFAPEMDVYSLAATLLYLLTGKDPVGAFDMKKGDVEETLSRHGVKLSATTLRALVHALQPEKEARTKDMETFLKELTAVPKPVGPVRKHLPVGFIVRGGRQDYCIKAFCGEKKGYEEYKATLYRGNGKVSDSRATQTATYTLRRFGVVMEQDGRAAITQAARIVDVERICKKVVKQWPVVHEQVMAGQRLNYELFTSDQKQLTFLVVSDKWKKPLPVPISIPWPLIRRWCLIGGAGIAAAAVVAFGIKQCSRLDGQHTDSVSVPITDSVATDSVDHSDDNVALPTDVPVVDQKATDQKTINDAQQMTQQQKAAADKAAAEQKAKEEAAKKKQEEAKKQEETKKQEEAKKKQEQTTQTKTDGALALEYARKGQYEKADYYGRKALRSGSGRSEANTALTLCKHAGLYDNNEHGGDPFGN